MVLHTEVPAVLGFSQAQAESLLHNAHLLPRVERVNGPSATSLTVTQQFPAGGQRAETNSIVTIQINTGPMGRNRPERNRGSHHRTGRKADRRGWIRRCDHDGAIAHRRPPEPGQRLALPPHSCTQQRDSQGGFRRQGQGELCRQGRAKSRRAGGAQARQGKVPFSEVPSPPQQSQLNARRGTAQRCRRRHPCDHGG